MRFTVRNSIGVLAIYYAMGALFAALPIAGIVNTYRLAKPFGKSDLVCALIIAVIALWLLCATLPKLIVFDEYVLARYLIIYIKIHNKNLMSPMIETKYSKDEFIGKVEYKVAYFYKNGRRLFGINLNLDNAERFVFECKQRNIKAHLGK
ncbi:hypothetical protein [Butyrivibrio sp. MC2021]|uniref:hypothetical protein n=1 Tax=Butyrivibrio sp. MC2021 TaxID=1408306 RepID=UPI00047D47B1|nr:hypothetical protein [Butyrivibrio sp. MC2021]